MLLSAVIGDIYDLVADIIKGIDTHRDVHRIDEGSSKSDRRCLSEKHLLSERRVLG